MHAKNVGAASVRRMQRLRQNRDTEVAPTLQQQAGRRGKQEKWEKGRHSRVRRVYRGCLCCGIGSRIWEPSQLCDVNCAGCLETMRRIQRSASRSQTRMLPGARLSQTQ